MAVDFQITGDNREQIMDEMNRRIEAALEACGNQAVSHAKSIITKESRVDTGALRNSVDHKVSDKVCYIGTNQSYAIYNEYGTGIYVEGGGGRQTPWVYVDAHGERHWTKGMKPIHFLKNAIQNNISEYKAIILQYLKK